MPGFQIARHAITTTCAPQPRPALRLERAAALVQPEEGRDEPIPSADLPGPHGSAFSELGRDDRGALLERLGDWRQEPHPSGAGDSRPSLRDIAGSSLIGLAFRSRPSRSLGHAGPLPTLRGAISSVHMRPPSVFLVEKTSM